MTRFLCTTAICTLCGATPALADLTVDEAWGVWKAQFQAYGLSVDAPESRDGDALVIGQITLSATFPMGMGNGFVSFTGPRFVPVGDGTVSVSFPEKGAFSLGGEIKDEGSFTASGEMLGSDAPGLMSGDAAHAVTDWKNDGTEINLTEVQIDGTQALDVSGALRMGPLSLHTETSIDDAHVNIRQTYAFDSYDVSYTLVIPDDAGAGGRVEAGGSALNMAGENEITLPRAGIDPMGLHEQLRNGLRMAEKTHAAQYSSYQRIMADGQPLSDQTMQASDYAVKVRLDEAGLDYGGTTGAFIMKMLSPELPFALAGQAESAAARLRVPLLKSDDTQKAALGMALNEVTLDDQIWGLVDPAGQLPRDPLTIAFDLGSDVSVLFEFLDIRALADGAKPVGLPLTADRVTLNSLDASGAGARLTGAGDFTFDYDDWATFDGMPAPEGTASFTLKGANGLIDTLISMGLMSDDDAMGARMMMGMFAKPGEGEDVLTSDIEVKKTGEVMVNGQRMR